MYPKKPEGRRPDLESGKGPTKAVPLEVTLSVSEQTLGVRQSTPVAVRSPSSVDSPGQNLLHTYGSRGRTSDSAVSFHFLRDFLDSTPQDLCGRKRVVGTPFPPRRTSQYHLHQDPDSISRLSSRDTPGSSVPDYHHRCVTSSSNPQCLFRVVRCRGTRTGSEVGVLGTPFRSPSAPVFIYSLSTSE